MNIGFKIYQILLKDVVAKNPDLSYRDCQKLASHINKNRIKNLIEFDKQIPNHGKYVYHYSIQELELLFFAPLTGYYKRLKEKLDLILSVKNFVTNSYTQHQWVA